MKSSAYSYNSQTQQTGPMGPIKTRFLAAPDVHPDQLKRVTGPLGGQIELEYEHTTKDGWRQTHKRLKQPRYVVYEIKSDADPVTGELRSWNPDPLTPSQGVSTTTYDYFEGFFDSASREFRGFGRVRSTNSLGTETNNYYHTDDNALKHKIDWTVVSDSSGELSRTLYDYDVISHGNGTYYETLLEKVEEFREGSNEDEAFKTTFYTYDQFGNLKTKLEDGSVIASSIRRAEEWDYIYNENSWMMSYPSAHRLGREDPNGGVYNPPDPDPNDAEARDYTETIFSYDSNNDPLDDPEDGLLRKESRRVLYFDIDGGDPNDPNSRLEGAPSITRHKYDGYGNKTELIDPNGNKTKFSYDSTRSYLTTIENTLGHQWNFKYHGIDGSNGHDNSESLEPGLMQSFTNSNSQETSYAYDSLGRLLSVYRPLDGNTPSVTYDYINFGPLNIGSQRVVIGTLFDKDNSTYSESISILDGFGRIAQSRADLPDDEDDNPVQLVSSQHFDHQGRLWRNSVPQQEAASSIYSPMTSPKWTRRTYDGLDRVTQEVGIDGYQKQYQYSYEGGQGLKTTFTNERGNSKDFYHDSYGRLRKVTEYNNEEAASTSYSYTLTDSLAEINDAQENTTQYAYDTLNRLQIRIHPDRGTWKWMYDGVGNMVEQIDGNGQHLRYDYDQLGRMVLKHAPGTMLGRFFYDNEHPALPDDSSETLTAFYDWGIDEASVNFDLPSGWAWGAAFQVGDINDPDRNTEVSVEDSSITFTGESYHGAIEHKFDPQFTSLPEIEKKLKLTITFQDHPDTRIYIQLRTYDDDSSGDLIADNIVLPGTSSSGNICTGQENRVTRDFIFDMDAYNETLDPNDPNTWVGNIVVKRHYGTATIFHSSLSLVNPDGEPIETQGTESAYRDFSVTGGIGQMTAFADPSGQAAMSYDARGRLTAERKVIEGLGYVTDYEYTADHLLSEITHPNNNATYYNYDNARRLTRLSHWTGSVPYYFARIVDNAKYNQWNLLQSFEHGIEWYQGPTQVYYHTIYGYRDLDLRLGSIISKTQDEQILQDFTYDYDSRGNVRSITDDSWTVTTGGRARGNFTYDDLDRLTEAVLADPIDPDNSSLTQTFSLDSIGNITQFTGAAQEFQNAHQPSRTTGYCGTYDYDFDGNGNLIRSTYTPFENPVPPGCTLSRHNNIKYLYYDLENRLEKVTCGDPEWDLAEFRYDAQGTRVKRILVQDGNIDVTTYVGPHYEKRPIERDGNTIRFYAFGKSVAEQTGGDSPYRYFLQDHLGSSSVVAASTANPYQDPNQWIEGVQVYAPYGADYWSPGDDQQLPTDSYKFTGQEQDLSWLYNYKARSYLPYVGVFAQPDPIDYQGRLADPQQLNPYAYARGNPLKYTDPSGKAAFLPALIIGAGLLIDHLVDPPSSHPKQLDKSTEQADAEFDAGNPIPEIYAAAGILAGGVGLLRALRNSDNVARGLGRVLGDETGSMPGNPPGSLSSDPGLDDFIDTLKDNNIPIQGRNVGIAGPDGNLVGEIDVVVPSALIQYKDGASSAHKIIKQVTERTEPYVNRRVVAFINDTSKAGNRTVSNAKEHIWITNKMNELIDWLTSSP